MKKPATCIPITGLDRINDNTNIGISEYHKRCMTLEGCQGKNIMEPNFTRVVAVMDGDGDWYVFPEELTERFWELNDEIGTTYDLDTIETFQKEFGGYTTGGDLNLVPLYIQN